MRHGGQLLLLLGRSGRQQRRLVGRLVVVLGGDLLGQTLGGQLQLLSVHGVLVAQRRGMAELGAGQRFADDGRMVVLGEGTGATWYSMNGISKYDIRSVNCSFVTAPNAIK